MAGSSEGSSDDSPPQIQFMSFGERDDADVQGVTEDTFLSFWELGNNNGAHEDQHIASIGGDTPVEVSLTRFDVSALTNVTVVSRRAHPLQLRRHQQRDDQSVPG